MAKSVLEDPGAVDLTANQENICREFTAFLRQHRTSAGDILLELQEGPWTACEMRALENSIRIHCSDERSMVEFFRVLKKVAVCWMMRHETSAPMPKIVVPVPAIQNPSRMSLAKAFQNYRNWATWLQAEIDTARPGRKHATLPDFSSIVPLVASAIMYGGLWSEPSLVSLVKTIPRLLSRTMASADAIYVGLTLRWGDTPFGEFRCWQPDPLTAIMLLRTGKSTAGELLAPMPSGESTTLLDSVIFGRIVAEFQRVREQSPERALCSLSSLMKSTQCIGFNCMPSVAAGYAARRVMSHSLSLEQIQRISGKEWLFGLPYQSGVAWSEEKQDLSLELSGSVPSWIPQLESAVLKQSAAISFAELDALSRCSELTPLAHRMIDFTRKAIVVPAIVKSAKSHELFARRLSVMATLMHRQWPNTDPSELGDDELEAGYKALVKAARDADLSGDTLRDLMYGLRHFHTYMRNCHSKGRLKDKGLLVPNSMLDRADVNLVTLNEYQGIRREIDLKWIGAANETRREVANLLVILGFRCGTRREEARLSKVIDLIVDGPIEFLIRPSEGHTVKSAAAIRRLPGLYMKPDEQAALRDWRKKRLQHCGKDASLFGDTLEESAPVSPSIFRSLNLIIARATETTRLQYPAHYHHLRHAFASWILLLLLLPEGSEPPKYLRKEDADWLIAGRSSFVPALRRRTQPWGGDVFLVSQALGHLHPATTMTRYFHFSGELLRIYLKRSPWLRPETEMLAPAMGRASDSQLDAESAMRFAVALLGKKAQADPLRPVPAKYEKPLTENPFYSRLHETYLFLRFLKTADGPIEAGQNFFGWDARRATAVFQAADYLRVMRTRNGSFRHHFRMVDSESGERVRCIEPTWPFDPNSDLVLRRFADRFEGLTDREGPRQTLMEGLDAYVSYVWNRFNYPVFLDPSTDGKYALSFIRMLEALGFKCKDIKYGSFDSRGSESRARWREELRPVRVRLERRGLPYWGTNGVKPWISIEPSFGFGLKSSEGSFGFRCLMVMAFIALSGEQPQG